MLEKNIHHLTCLKPNSAVLSTLFFFVLEYTGDISGNYIWPNRMDLKGCFVNKKILTKFIEVLEDCVVLLKIKFKGMSRCILPQYHNLSILILRNMRQYALGQRKWSICETIYWGLYMMQPSSEGHLNVVLYKFSIFICSSLFSSFVILMKKSHTTLRNSYYFILHVYVTCLCHCHFYNKKQLQKVWLWLFSQNVMYINKPSLFCEKRFYIMCVNTVQYMTLWAQIGKMANK